MSQPVHIFAALPPATEDAAVWIDPVCRMAVDPGRAAEALIRDGREYHFCSRECAQRFASTPDQYTK